MIVADWIVQERYVLALAVTALAIWAISYAKEPTESYHAPVTQQVDQLN